MKKKYIIAIVAIIIVLAGSFFVYNRMSDSDDMPTNPTEHLSGDNCTPKPGINCPASAK